MNWLVGVICLMSVGASPYADYSVAKMPQYDMGDDNLEVMPGLDDYKYPSPDAPPSLDYPYEPQDKTEETPGSEDEPWNRRSDIERKISKSSGVRADLQTDNHSGIKIRSSRRFQKHRPRTKQHFVGSKRRVNHERQYDDIAVADNYYKKEKYDTDEETDLDYKYTTQKIIRRKVRDRTFNHDRIKSRDIVDDLNTDIDEESLESVSSEEHKANIVKERSQSSGAEMKKLNLKNFVEDEEYYDMKRVNNIKNKLPELLRRTKEETSTTASPGPHIGDFRRVNMILTTTDKALILVTTTINTTESMVNTISNRTDLSMAEKSRLSILRKSQKKNSVKNVTMTTKPPVLMQVTSKMQTVVMVEPRNEVQQLRAREVFDSSPDKIAKVKKLMRKKLVAGARRIEDLTDNWDEMICDYIDVSLVDNSAVLHSSNIILPSIISVYALFIF